MFSSTPSSSRVSRSVADGSFAFHAAADHDDEACEHRRAEVVEVHARQGVAAEVVGGEVAGVEAVGGEVAAKELQ